MDGQMNPGDNYLGRYCSDCGKPIGGNNRYCTGCGADLMQWSRSAIPANRNTEAHNVRALMLSNGIIELAVGGLFAILMLVSLIGLSSAHTYVSGVPAWVYFVGIVELIFAGALVVGGIMSIRKPDELFIFHIVLGSLAVFLYLIDLITGAHDSGVWVMLKVLLLFLGGLAIITLSTLSMPKAR